MAASSTKSTVVPALPTKAVPVQVATDLGRTIAPVHEPEPLDVRFRNNFQTGKCQILASMRVMRRVTSWFTLTSQETAQPKVKCRTSPHASATVCRAFER